jgi:cation diffusion facilitator CzcD-associated flavoprotein CzcO
MTDPASLAVNGLEALEARLAQDLSWLDLPAKPWVPAFSLNGQTVLPVVIIGAGMAGLAAAAALSHLGIVAPIYDHAAEGYEGPWATTARMETLRSPKQLTGPALGLPALTFRAWFEAQFGAQTWHALDKIPRIQWMDYLRWYRRVTNAVVHNRYRLMRLAPRADRLVDLHLDTPDGPAIQVARRVVLATGRDGLGGPSAPDFVSALPRDRWAHSSDDMDYARMKGLRVGIIGAGSSAMDSAATALEAGAASVDLFIRRSDIPRINKGKGAGSPGMTHGFSDLPDEWKWRMRHYVNAQQVPPPRGSTLRVSRHANARFNLGCAVLSATIDHEKIRVDTSKGVFRTDFLIAATGFKVDMASRPEYEAIASHVRLWRERYTPPAGDDDAELASMPVLGDAFEFQERTPGQYRGLDRIHCFCYPATLSHGSISGDIPAISDGAKRLAQHVASLLYGEDIAKHYATLEAYAEAEILGDEWTPAPAPISEGASMPAPSPKEPIP